MHLIKIFVSYSRKDLPFVGDLVNRLRMADFETWMDLIKIAPTDRWNQAIEQALKECTHFVVVVSPYSMASPNVMQEIDTAFHYNKTIIPVLLQETKVPDKLGEIQLIDFRVDFERGIQELKAVLERGVLIFERQQIDTPARSIRWLGYTPLFFAACPLSIKVTTFLQMLGAFFKAIPGGAVSVILFYYPNVAKPLDDWRALLALYCITLYFWGIFQSVCGYLAARRRLTFAETLFVQISGLFFVPLFYFLSGAPNRLPPLSLFTFLIMIAVVLDIIGLVAMILPKSYRRWMIGYPSWGREAS
jgi:hypothetical protein